MGTIATSSSRISVYPPKGGYQCVIERLYPNGQGAAELALRQLTEKLFSLGYFDPQQEAYLRNHEKGQAEVLSLTGNLALYKNEPFFHVHVALGLRDGSTRGGHLFEAMVRPTVELVLTTYSRSVQRRIDPDTGLPLLDP